MNSTFIKFIVWYLFTISKPDLSVLEFHHFVTLSPPDNNQFIKNAWKLIVIAKTYKFNSLSKAVIDYMEALHRPQKEAIALVHTLIKLLNLSKVQKILKRDSIFKAFIVE